MIYVREENINTSDNFKVFLCPFCGHLMRFVATSSLNFSRCGSCQKLMPAVEKLISSLSERILFHTVGITTNNISEMALEDFT